MTAFPQTGLPREELFKQLDAYKAQDGDWKKGRTWALVYDAGDEITGVMEQVYAKFYHTNGNNPFVFQSLKRLETETISMAADLFHGGASTVGSLTSCGSESLLVALKAYRDEARAEKPHITQPEVILAETAHAALFKAAHYLDVKPVAVPVDKNYQIDLRAVRTAINERTIALVGSAPQYPQGIIDPIAELGQIALEYDLRLHVDACLGGFILPFLRDIGENIPPFDFEVPGVSSLSADLHKYGFAAKGVSAVLYREKSLRAHQYYSLTDWPGGLFSSPSATGTRPGGAIATAWAALKYIGRERYDKIARGILQTTRKLLDGIRAIEELHLFGNPQASIFSFGSDTLDVHALADILESKGWAITQQSNPDALHFMVTPAHAQAADAFLADLNESVAALRAQPGAYADGSAKLYRIAKSIPGVQTRTALLTEIFNIYMTEDGTVTPDVLEQLLQPGI